MFVTQKPENVFASPSSGETVVKVLHVQTNALRRDFVMPTRALACAFPSTLGKTAAIFVAQMIAATAVSV